MTHPNTDEQSQSVPESVQLAVKVWAVALLLEVLHQILNVVMGILNRAETAHEVSARVTESGTQPMPDAGTIQFMVVGTNVLLGILSLSIVAVLWWMVRSLHHRGRFVGFARSGLTYFGIYLGLRGLFAFAAAPVGMVPIALFAVDGSLRILVGVAAVIAVVFCSREETITWSGEAPMRQLPDNMRRDSK